MKNINGMQTCFPSTNSSFPMLQLSSFVPIQEVQRQNEKGVINSQAMPSSLATSFHAFPIIPHQSPTLPQADKNTISTSVQQQSSSTATIPPPISLVTQSTSGTADKQTSPHQQGALRSPPKGQVALAYQLPFGNPTGKLRMLERFFDTRVPFLHIGDEKYLYLEIFSRFISPFYPFLGKDISFFAVLPFKAKDYLMEMKKREVLMKEQKQQNNEKEEKEDKSASEVNKSDNNTSPKSHSPFSPTETSTKATSSSSSSTLTGLSSSTTSTASTTSSSSSTTSYPSTSISSSSISSSSSPLSHSEPHSSEPQREKSTPLSSSSPASISTHPQSFSPQIDPKRLARTLTLTRYEHLLIHYFDSLHLTFYCVMALSAQLIGHSTVAALCIRQARLYAAIISDSVGNVVGSKTALVRRLMNGVNLLAWRGERLWEDARELKAEELKEKKLNHTVRDIKKEGKESSAGSIISEEKAAKQESDDFLNENSLFVHKDSSLSSNLSVETNQNSEDPPSNSTMKLEAFLSFIRTLTLDSIVASSGPFSAEDTLEVSFVIEYTRGIFLLAQFFRNNQQHRCKQLIEQSFGLMTSEYLVNIYTSLVPPFHALVNHPQAVCPQEVRKSNLTDFFDYIKEVFSLEHVPSQEQENKSDSCSEKECNKTVQSAPLKMKQQFLQSESHTVYPPTPQQCISKENHASSGEHASNSSFSSISKQNTNLLDDFPSTYQPLDSMSRVLDPTPFAPHLFSSRFEVFMLASNELRRFSCTDCLLKQLKNESGLRLANLRFQSSRSYKRHKIKRIGEKDSIDFQSLSTAIANDEETQENIISKAKTKLFLDNLFPRFGTSRQGEESMTESLSLASLSLQSTANTPLPNLIPSPSALSSEKKLVSASQSRQGNDLAAASPPLPHLKKLSLSSCEYVFPPNKFWRNGHSQEMPHDPYFYFAIFPSVKPLVRKEKWAQRYFQSLSDLSLTSSNVCNDHLHDRHQQSTGSDMLCDQQTENESISEETSVLRTLRDHICLAEMNQREEELTNRASMDDLYLLTLQFLTSVQESNRNELRIQKMEEKPIDCSAQMKNKMNYSCKSHKPSEDDDIERQDQSLIGAVSTTIKEEEISIEKPANAQKEEEYIEGSASSEHMTEESLSKYLAKETNSLWKREKVIIYDEEQKRTEQLLSQQAKNESSQNLISAPVDMARVKNGNAASSGNSLTPQSLPFVTSPRLAHHSLNPTKHHHFNSKSTAPVFYRQLHSNEDPLRQYPQKYSTHLMISSLRSAHTFFNMSTCTDVAPTVRLEAAQLSYKFLLNSFFPSFLSNLTKILTTNSFKNNKNERISNKNQAANIVSKGNIEQNSSVSSSQTSSSSELHLPPLPVQPNSDFQNPFEYMAETTNVTKEELIALIRSVSHLQHVICLCGGKKVIPLLSLVEDKPNNSKREKRQTIKEDRSCNNLVIFNAVAEQRIDNDDAHGENENGSSNNSLNDQLAFIKSEKRHYLEMEQKKKMQQMKKERQPQRFVPMHRLLNATFTLLSTSESSANTSICSWIKEDSSSPVMSTSGNEHLQSKEIKKNELIASEETQIKMEAEVLVESVDENEQKKASSPINVPSLKKKWLSFFSESYPDSSKYCPLIESKSPSSLDKLPSQLSPFYGILETSVKKFKRIHSITPPLYFMKKFGNLLRKILEEHREISNKTAESISQPTNTDKSPSSNSQSTSPHSISPMKDQKLPSTYTTVPHKSVGDSVVSGVGEILSTMQNIFSFNPPHHPLPPSFSVGSITTPPLSLALTSAVVFSLIQTIILCSLLRLHSAALAASINLTYIIYDIFIRNGIDCLRSCFEKASSFFRLLVEEYQWEGDVTKALDSNNLKKLSTSDGSSYQKGFSELLHHIIAEKFVASVSYYLAHKEHLSLPIDYYPPQPSFNRMFHPNDTVSIHTSKVSVFDNTFQMTASNFEQDNLLESESSSSSTNDSAITHIHLERNKGKKILAQFEGDKSESQIASVKGLGKEKEEGETGFTVVFGNGGSKDTPLVSLWKHHPLSTLRKGGDTESTSKGHKKIKQSGKEKKKIEEDSEGSSTEEKESEMVSWEEEFSEGKSVENLSGKEEEQKRAKGKRRGKLKREQIADSIGTRKRRKIDEESEDDKEGNKSRNELGKDGTSKKDIFVSGDSESEASRSGKLRKKRIVGKELVRSDTEGTETDGLLQRKSSDSDTSEVAITFRPPRRSELSLPLKLPSFAASSSANSDQPKSEGEKNGQSSSASTVLSLFSNQSDRNASSSSLQFGHFFAPGQTENVQASKPRRIYGSLQDFPTYPYPQLSSLSRNSTQQKQKVKHSPFVSSNSSITASNSDFSSPSSSPPYEIGLKSHLFGLQSGTPPLLDRPFAHLQSSPSQNIGGGVLFTYSDTSQSPFGVIGINTTESGGMGQGTGLGWSGSPIGAGSPEGGGLYGQLSFFEGSGTDRSSGTNDSFEGFGDEMGELGFSEASTLLSDHVDHYPPFTPFSASVGASGSSGTDFSSPSSSRVDYRMPVDAIYSNQPSSLIDLSNTGSGSDHISGADSTPSTDLSSSFTLSPSSFSADMSLPFSGSAYPSSFSADPLDMPFTSIF
ncbi:uncharacterized protein MONOS_7235 [Monocercomonoides exilis]|uniref:uncharacterized protein n=1 Tax=Monocercomonoides exilis TaxID=2049356 RepID=UPI00355A820D|nr:hypothetical protein MONOS_7235 [Monocercomonoides exilis]|eukprot:MONOS_7235.1-p1 / transcript=MONOS_7235.1 / gene=MONOS_7235 / organism=Monocercomonoides_exilis_PA203 / gene_product=unspecified product / transcript_product=unspecified product / location=Mono_scaffold00242:51579-60270(-) / protein_length=2584 / sequence_SO=supercontig / SO=protein_coding / is_pseudo=false